MNIKISFRTTKGNFGKLDQELVKKVINDLSSKYKYTLEIDEEDKNKFILNFMTEEFLVIYLEDIAIVGGITTDLRGPGIHKHVIEYLDELFQALNLTNKKVEDKSGFWYDRDFDKLKQYYIDNLEEDLKIMVSDFPRLNWPFNWEVNDSKEILTHMGDFDKDYIEKLLLENKVEEFARNYFIWFNDSIDASLYKNTIIHLMHCVHPWVKPRHDGEEALNQDILKYYDLAINLDSSIEIREKEIEEIKYLAGIIDQEPVYEEGYAKIGFRRKTLKRIISDNFYINIPGNYYTGKDDIWDVFEDDIRSIIIRTELTEKEASFLDDYTNIDSSYSNVKVVEFEEEGYKFLGRYFFNEHDKYQLMGEVINGHIRTSISFISPNYYDYEYALDLFKALKPKLINNNTFGVINLKNNEYEKVVSFGHNGILIYNDNKFINYENIVFKVEGIQKSMFLTFYFENIEGYAGINKIPLSNKLIHHLKEKKVNVEGLDHLISVINTRKKKITVKKTYKMYNDYAPKSILLGLVFMIFLIFYGCVFLLSFGNLYLSIIVGVFIFLLFFSIYFGIGKQFIRKLIVSNVGLNNVFFDTNQIRNNIFIDYDDLVKIEIKGNKIIFQGKFDTIRFLYSKELLGNVERYIDLDKVSIEYMKE